MQQADREFMANLHYRTECIHGVVVGQCRCPGPKATRIVRCPPSCEPGGETLTEFLARRQAEEERYARMQEAEL